MSVPLDELGCPDLQTLVERAGRRRAIIHLYLDQPCQNQIQIN
jgi:hypothetical protein